jgi:flagellin
MPIYVLGNIPSLNAQRNLGVAQRSLNQALERLSSGLRINSAKDDAAGMLIAARTQKSIIAWSVGANNLRLGGDLLATADSFGSIIIEDLQRMYDLTNQSLNGLLSDSERDLLNNEFRDLRNEVQRLAVNTRFLSQSLLTGDVDGLSVRTGEGAGNIVTLSIYGLTTGNAAAAGGISIALNVISSQGGASDAFVALSAAIERTTSTLGYIGAKSAAFAKSIDATDALVENLTSARNRIVNADVAAETTNLTNAQIIVQSGISALVQANSAQTLALSLLGGN